jgi:hypothetical protein
MSAAAASKSSPASSLPLSITASEACKTAEPPTDMPRLPPVRPGGVRSLSPITRLILSGMMPSFSAMTMRYIVVRPVPYSWLPMMRVTVSSALN